MADRCYLIMFQHLQLTQVFKGDLYTFSGGNCQTYFVYFETIYSKRQELAPFWSKVVSLVKPAKISSRVSILLETKHVSQFLEDLCLRCLLVIEYDARERNKNSL